MGEKLEDFRRSSLRRILWAGLLLLGLSVIVAIAAGVVTLWLAASHRWVVRAELGAGVGTALVLLFGALLLGPASRWLSGADDVFLSAETPVTLKARDRLRAVNSARQTLMQSVYGVVVIVGVVFTAAGLVYTSRTLRVNEQGQITDRYARSIEQLGSDKPEVRLGGIYALERLVRDSSRDRDTIVEVLAAYIRTHAQDRPPVGSPSLRLAVDVQAAFTVIGRNRGQSHVRVDLTSADLHNKNLDGMDLHDVTLHEANLAGAHLNDATLVRADLTKVDLTGALLERADLTDANLTSGLRNPSVGANLSGADLKDTDLTRTDLSGANLKGIQNINPTQIKQTAITDARTQF